MGAVERNFANIASVEMRCSFEFPIQKRQAKGNFQMLTKSLGTSLVTATPVKSWKKTLSHKPKNDGS